ncbi:MAG TPA: deoxyribodipyrimidine photo-lyase [Patescibacteria group bacterium]|nr:deoxyribodipyrimidine photo-lyase [Patescibacteria group bacterium]
MTRSAGRGHGSVLWFRRDLRVHDHPALVAAVARGPVAPLFVLDPALLTGRFASPNRTWFLLGAVEALGIAVAALGGRRDRAVADILAHDGITLDATPGVLIQEPEDVLAGTGRSYSVFTPFLRRWEALPVRPTLAAPDRLVPPDRSVSRMDLDGPDPLAVVGALVESGPAGLSLEAPSADLAQLPAPGEVNARRRLRSWLAGGPDHGPAAYAATRDRLDDSGGTSRLGPDLRFGLLSPVEVASRALAADGGGVGSRRFVSELAWRDFYAHHLWHEPRVAREPFQRRYLGYDWPGGMPTEIGPLSPSAPPPPADAWRAGRTGYPIVDAAMRQLAATGFMPNRARMIVSSFLTKDLLIDWRVGEAHFMHHLLDGDPASNLGGWQWAASVGTDAQPYFRVLNPVNQGQRFDPDGAYVRAWVPELSRVPVSRIHAPWAMSVDEQATAGCRIGIEYPAPLVDHAAARRRALAWFAAVRAAAAGEPDRRARGPA